MTLLLKAQKTGKLDPAGKGKQKRVLTENTAGKKYSPPGGKIAEKRSFPGKIAAYLTIIRPYQWIKNILVFAPVFFGGKLTDFVVMTQAGLAAFMFCIAASIGYVFNDWMDRKEDKNHPTKCMRPFASEILNGRDAVFLLIVLVGVLIMISIALLHNPWLLICIYAYLLMSLLYSCCFKKIVLLEIYIVSFFFVMRVLAGGIATEISISNWMFATIFFLSILISVAKRKTEIMVIGNSNMSNHRATLKFYSVDYMDHFLWASGVISIVTYALYTVEKGQFLVYSLIPATYGITKFIMITNQGRGGDPILALIKDIHLIMATLIFLAIIYCNIYLLRFVV